MSNELSVGQSLALRISQEMANGYVRFIPGTSSIIYWESDQRTYAMNVQLDDGSVRVDATRAHIQVEDGAERVHLFESHQNSEDNVPEDLLGVIIQAEIILTTAYRRDVTVAALITRQ